MTSWVFLDSGRHDAVVLPRWQEIGDLLFGENFGNEVAHAGEDPVVGAGPFLSRIIIKIRNTDTNTGHVVSTFIVMFMNFSTTSTALFAVSGNRQTSAQVSLVKDWYVILMVCIAETDSQSNNSDC